MDFLILIAVTAVLLGGLMFYAANSLDRTFQIILDEKEKQNR